MNFIMIDNDKSYIFIATKILNKAFEINSLHSFSDPVQALAAMQENMEEWKRHIVLLDLNMPVLDGFQVLEKLAQLENNPYEVIIVSSTTLKPEIEKASTYSFVKGFIPKPLNPQKLTDLMAIDNMEIINSDSANEHILLHKLNH